MLAMKWAGIMGLSLIRLLGKKARLVGIRTMTTKIRRKQKQRRQRLKHRRGSNHSLFSVTFTSTVKPARNHQLISSSSMDDGSDKAYSPDLANRGAGMSSSSLPLTTTSVHVTALDGVVNVNSLFTIAVFVGLSLTTQGQHSLENPGGCDAGTDVVKRLLVFEVVSFSFFLFSSLVAQGLKLAINLLNSNDVDEAFRAKISLKVLRLGMLGSAVGSVMGCLFLMLSMVCVIEIRLGTLSCGSRSAIDAVSALVVLVSSALLVYISTAVYSFML